MTVLRHSSWLSMSLMLLTACGPLPWSPTPTPTPTIVPTPAPALSTEDVWLAPDGLSDSVTAVGADGLVVSTRLPLNAPQRASDVAASLDGRYLAYLVWDAPDEQHGIASWLLTEPNARLIYQPLSGYRVIDLQVAADSRTLLFLEVQQGKLPAQADWRLQSMPLGGGTPRLLASADSQPDLLPPRPVGLLSDGSLVLNANTRYDVPSGKVLQGNFVLASDGTLRFAGQASDRVVGDGELSPDSTRLVYSTYEGVLPGQPGGSATNVVRVVTLATGDVVTLKSPSGGIVFSMRWYPDSRHLLIDHVPPAPGGPTARGPQSWALVDFEDASSWLQTSADVARATLFTYAPYRAAGVAYTEFPTTGDVNWTLYILPDIAVNSAPKMITLGKIDPSLGVPRVIRTP